MENQETFLSHLIELRDRLIRCLLVVGIAFVPAFIYSADLYDLHREALALLALMTLGMTFAVRRFRTTLD